ncbi:MAG TPA: hypothetical protein VJU82_04640, partial [Acidobacteriaceae bacterium]|nr:hypothetical protein [Acidobacteriaceae bacterium]
FHGGRSITRIDDRIVVVARRWERRCDEKKRADEDIVPSALRLPMKEAIGDRSSGHRDQT